MKTLNDLLDETASRVPNKPFLVTAEESITFKEFRERVLRTAAGFWGRGIQKGQCVAIVHRNTPDFVTAYLALSRLGAVAVPVNFMVQKPDELAYMFNDCGAVGAVTQKEFLRGMRGAAAKCPALKTLWVTDAPGELSPKQPSWREENFSSLNEDPAKLPSGWLPKEQDTAGILYTSGTTGHPKGVMLTHRNFVTNCEEAAILMGLTGKDVGLCILPLFHSFAWTGNFLIALKLGLKLVMAPSITPPKPWLTLMGRHGVTLFSAVPQLYAVLASQVSGLKGLVLKYWFFRKARFAVSGSAPLSPATADAFEKAFGLPINEGYGLTETSPVATINPPGRAKRGSVGVPIKNVSIKIVDDAGAELPAGQEGEIVVKGDCVMKGYYNLPDATREAFTADGFFKTGDIGALDSDGYLYIRDRKKDMIIIKGLKVFSAQVEAGFLEHPAVEEAAIIGIPDEHGDETIKAFVVLKKDAAADKAGLMQFARGKFDPYKRPRDIEIVESLPKNALQKVLKRALRQRELEKRAV